VSAAVRALLLTKSWQVSRSLDNKNHHTSHVYCFLSGLAWLIHSRASEGVWVIFISLDYGFEEVSFYLSTGWIAILNLAFFLAESWPSLDKVESIYGMVVL
jgi:hypothetical protein